MRQERSFWGRLTAQFYRATIVVPWAILAHVLRPGASSRRPLKPLSSLSAIVSATALMLGCGQLIGLSDYELEEGDGGTSLGGAQASTGGSATSSGGATAGSGGAAATGGTSSGAGPGADCMDSGDCRAADSCSVGTCSQGKCSYEQEAVGTPCDAGVCSPAGACRVCIDSEPGSRIDLGCSEATPSCQNETCSACEVTLMSPTVADGSFENGVHAESSWFQYGDSWIVEDCYGKTCIGRVSNVAPTHGHNLAWLGSIDGFDGWLSRSVNVPAGAKSLNIKADINFQTDSAATENQDYYRVILEDADAVLLTTLQEAWASDAQITGGAWEDDGWDFDVDVSGVAGQSVTLKILFLSDNPTKPGNENDDPTALFVDNIRIVANLCE